VNRTDVTDRGQVIGQRVRAVLDAMWQHDAVSPMDVDELVAFTRDALDRMRPVKASAMRRLAIDVLHAVQRALERKP
jgi:hypothetical protein